jgi:hypothetical protein
MKTVTLLIVAFLISISIKAQEITGQWNGILKVPGVQLRLVFNITKTENGFSTTMDSPDQGAKGIPVSSTKYENSKLKLEITNAQIEYNGDLKDTKITGTFKQGGQEFPLDLTKGKIENQTIIKPQEPKKSTLYNTEELTITQLIKGSLYSPLKQDGKTNLVILIAGSGPTDRDGNQNGVINNSLKYLAEELSTSDHAVFSYDKRIISQMVNGTINESTLTFEDFINDAKEVFAFFKKQKKYNKIIIAGHSEGSQIGMIAANGKADAFISLEGPGRPIDKVLLEQIGKQDPKLTVEVQKYLEILKNGKTFELKNQILASLFRKSVQPYMISWIKYNPQDEIKKLKIPVLVINGTKDLQVSIADANLLKQAKPDAKLVIIKNMNHIFKEIKAGDTENKDSYTNPNLPVMTDLIININQFIKLL